MFFQKERNAKYFKIYLITRCMSVSKTYLLVLHVVYFKPSPPGKFDYPEVSFLLTLKDQTYFPRLSKIRNIKNKKSSILE